MDGLELQTSLGNVNVFVPQTNETNTLSLKRPLPILNQNFVLYEYILYAWE